MYARDIKWRQAQPSDAKIICEMREPDDTRDNLHDCRRFGVENCREWLHNMGGSSERWVIESTDGKDTFVGLVRVDQIDHINQTCCVGLDIHPNQRRKGYGMAAWGMVITELFQRRNMHLIWLEVLETNEVAHAMYKKLGFQQDGILRDRILRNGERINSVVMSMQRQEWLICVRHS